MNNYKNFVCTICKKKIKHKQINYVEVNNKGLTICSDCKDIFFALQNER